MKAISLCQPWASLVAVGAKQMETRSWAVPDSLKGQRVAIHAAQSLDYVGGESGLIEKVHSQPFRDCLVRGGYLDEVVESLPRGGLVATAILKDCLFLTGVGTIPFSGGLRLVVSPGSRVLDISEQEAAFGCYSPGRYLWLLEDIERLEAPLPCKGRQGLFNIYHAEIMQPLQAAIRKAQGGEEV